MLTLKQTWTYGPEGSSAVPASTFGVFEVPCPPTECVLYIACSTLATTQSFALVTAQESSGPWFIEASTVVALNVSTAFALRINGPVGPFVRPVINTASSGTYSFLLLGVE